MGNRNEVTPAEISKSSTSFCFSSALQPYVSHTMNAPAQVALAQQLVKHHGLMRPVKRAQAQMHHARRMAGARIGGRFDGAGQLGKGGVCEVHGDAKLHRVVC